MAGANTVSTSSRVGIDSFEPISRVAARPVGVRSRTAPVPSVVRSSPVSWMTTSSPARVRWTSNSIASRSRVIAWRNPLTEFSGQSPRAPR